VRLKDYGRSRINVDTCAALLHCSKLMTRHEWTTILSSELSCKPSSSQIIQHCAFNAVLIEIQRFCTKHTHLHGWQELLEATRLNVYIHSTIVDVLDISTAHAVGM